MRYFTKELLVAISSCDRKKAEKAMLQLKENHKLYLQEWQRIKYKLPRTVRRYFEKYGSFHDYVFVEIRFCQGGHGKKVCFLELCNEKNKNICIKLRDVSSILIKRIIIFPHLMELRQLPMQIRLQPDVVTQMI